MPPTNSEAGGFGTSAGIAVSQESALQIAAVYGCASLLSSSVATLPARLLNSKTLRDAKELKPSPLITEPYSEISLFDWMVQFVASLAIRGNFYGHIISRDKNLYPTQIKPIPPDNADVKRLQDGSIEYRFYNRVVPTRDVYHVRMLSMPGMLEGVNPVQYLRLSFGLSLAQKSYAGGYFRNSANPQGVIQVPGALSKDETKKMLKNWLANHQGINQSNLPALLTDGAEFKAISITPQDSQFLQSQGFSAEEITGTIYRVPPHMVGLNEKVSSWGRGLEQMEKGYTLNTLADYTGRYETSMTSLHPPGQFVNLDLSNRLRGDTLERAQTGSLGTAGGFLTPNDARALLDLPSRPDGDELFAPINTELLEKAQVEVEAAIKAKNEPKPDPVVPDPNAPEKEEPPKKS